MEGLVYLQLRKGVKKMSVKRYINKDSGDFADNRLYQNRVIEAIQYDGSYVNKKELIEFAGEGAVEQGPVIDKKPALVVDGYILLELNDWLIKGVEDMLFRFKDEYFKQYFREVSDEEYNERFRNKISMRS